MPTFYLDEKPIEFEAGEKILSAALKAGIEIPHYCYHPALSVVATCRMCLVDVVDMGNGRPAPKLMTSCSTDAAEGMKVLTHNESVREGRELVMEFLLIIPWTAPFATRRGSVPCRIILTTMEAVNLKWNIPNGSMAGATSALLSCWNATAVSTVHVVIVLLGKSRAPMSLVCSTGVTN